MIKITIKKRFKISTNNPISNNSNKRDNSQLKINPKRFKKDPNLKGTISEGIQLSKFDC